ncbi:hypothetical protein [Lysobacter fragariae]
MNSPVLTLKVWSVYVVATGLGLLFVPGLVLALLGLPPPGDIWVHVLGLVAVVLGFYYWAGAVTLTRSFFVATVFGRCLFFAGCVGLVLLAAAPWQVILLGAVDLVGAAWTGLALGRQSRA